MGGPNTVSYGLPGLSQAQIKTLANNSTLGTPNYQMAYGDLQGQLQDLLRQAPMKQPDLSDPNILAARQAQMTTDQLRRGRASTFNQSIQPDLLTASVGNKQLLGG